LEEDYQILQRTQPKLTYNLAYFIIVLLFEHELGVIIIFLLPSLKPFLAVVFVTVHLFMASLP
jgi:hypothetical protein